MGPATSPDFFSPRNSEKHTQEFDSVGLLPRALRDLFIWLEQKANSLNGGGNSGSDNPANDNTNDNTAITNGDSIGIAATKSPSPKSRPNKSKKQEKQPFEYQVKLQFLELYGEDINDLLTKSAPSSKSKITIREIGGDAEAIGATAVSVSNAQEAMVCLTRGMLRRVTGATAMNAESSRSHAIMSIILEQVTRSPSEDGGDTAVVASKSKFNFVDLAGAERQKRTGAKGQRQKEGININKGLLVLGNVISALAAGGGKFVPFRDSKLTRLLRGSLGGNHRTLMIACASPSHKNAEESLNCLRYANRAKNIQNKATKNIDPHSKLVNALKGQVTALAGELLRLSNKGGGKVNTERFTSELLEALVKGGKEAQSISIGGKANGGDSSAPKSESNGSSDKQSTSSSSVETLTAELEKTRLSLEDTQRDLSNKSEELEKLRRESSGLSDSSAALATPSKSTYATPSKAIGMGGGDESIRHILTSLSNAGDEGASDAGVMSPDAISEGAEIGTTSSTPANRVTIHSEELQSEKVKELSSEIETLRLSLDRFTTLLNEKSEELEAAMAENESLREKLRETPDIDEETIHYIVKNITSYDDARMETFQSDEEEEEETSSVGSSTSSTEEEEVDEERKGKNEELSNFASAMFSTGKFLVDREMFEDSIVCFETVLEVRRELYGWDDPLVGDALHMEGFVRSKMAQYDRALMLLWDALRIRKIASEPLKISATLRLLADLHFSKEENMHAACEYHIIFTAVSFHSRSLVKPHIP